VKDFDSLYLITHKTDNGLMRWIELPDSHDSMDVRSDTKRAGKMMWLPGIEGHQSCNKWKLRAVRLV
jgi:hypothetical protein